MERFIEGNYLKKDNAGDFCFGNVESAYGATERYFTKEGKPWLPVFGELHFSRLDRATWKRELDKVAGQGLDGLSVYVFWNHHEKKRGEYDFNGDNDLKRFLALAKDRNLGVVLRIGPWCHGEARRGGFPDYLTKIAGKRRDTPAYLAAVRRWWSALYEEVKEFCDGKTIVGIQLENEYTGGISHIKTLRSIAEEIGFRTPFFTMTAWPTNTPDRAFVPMCGGYPEAPWTQNKRPLVPNERFRITAGRTEAEIGEDLNRTKKPSADFSAFPYAGCEVGTGNQPTQHRRPIISDRDGFGVAFAKLASGMNWLGYYMYHGGRNPRGKPMQESKRTCYPNDYPVIDYDFQAPVSKDGDLRRHADRLRLLHIFLNHWDPEFARTEAYFAKERSLPYLSLRAAETGGYVFVSNYERGLSSEDLRLNLRLRYNGTDTKLEGLNVGRGAMFFFPVRINLNGIYFESVTAQPIARIDAEDGTDAYFMRPEGVKTVVWRGEEGIEVTDDTAVYEENGKKVRLHFLTEDRAYRCYADRDGVFFADGAAFRIEGKTYAERHLIEESDAAARFVSLKEIQPLRLKYGSFLFTRGRRRFYRLAIDKALFERYEDALVELDFVGLNLQIFHEKTLVDDCFNTDGVCRFRLARLRKELTTWGELTIKAAAATRFGRGNVYREIEMPAGAVRVELKRVIPIGTEEIPRGRFGTVEINRKEDLK